MNKGNEAMQSDLVKALITQIERAGGRVEQEEKFAQQYGLNFTITRFENVYAHVNLGVHVTPVFDELDELDQFSLVSKRGIVMKSLYIEIDPGTLDGGGLLVAMNACLSFLFERRHNQARAMGVRIHEDCSFQFFSLDDAIHRLDLSEREDDLQIGEDIEGRIIAYFTDKGFGFIQNDDEQKFFFHIANIVDDELRARLPSYVPGEIIPVDFQYGGNDGKKYPKAINVALPFEE